MPQEYRSHTAVEVLQALSLLPRLAGAPTVGTVRLPGRNELGENEPQAPGGKDGDQGHRRPNAVQQRQNGNDDTNQDGDAAPKGV